MDTDSSNRNCVGKYLNFGIIFNCEDEFNFGLNWFIRYIETKSSIMKDKKQLPTIFSSVKRTGYKTGVKVLFYSQIIENPK